MKTMIINARVLMHAQRCVKEEAVLIEDGTILDIASECELPHAEQVIDAEGLYLAPGLLDTHTHGIGGFDFNTCTAQAIEEIIALEHAEGVTGFLASLVVENHAMTMERLQLLDEIDRISQTTDFDGIPLFKEYPGNLPPGYVPPEKEGEITLQIGHSEAETLDVERYYMGSKELLLKDMDFTTVDNANQAVDTIEDAIEAVADVRASFGASLNHLEHTSSNLGVTKENMTVAESRIRDTDMAEQITAYTTENIILQSSNSMMVHANSLPDLVIQLLQG